MGATQSFGTPWLMQHLAALVPDFPARALMVAFSGGVDSTALLAALAADRSKSRAPLRAVHVNHGLHSNAAQWAKHCRELARSLRVPLTVLTTQVVRTAGQSLEAQARDARYTLLSGELKPGECLLTAHHEDDQLETVLLQLLRGAGVAGLAAMPAMCRFAGGWLVRPLLSCSRTQLQQWTVDRGLSWIEDDTNSDEKLDRNYLRRQVLPVLRQRWPGMTSAAARSARHLGEAQRLLQELGRADAQRAGSGPDLFVPALRRLPQDRRRNALRWWIAQSGVRLPDTTRLEQIAGPLLAARQDAHPRVAWGDAEAWRHADLLSLAPRLKSLEGAAAGITEWAWQCAPRLQLPDGGGTLELREDAHGPIDADRLPALLTVGYRQGGERLRPRRGGPRRTLKSLLQQSQLPISERNRLPLIFSGTALLAAGGLWVDESIQSSADTRRRLRLILQA